MKSNLKFFKNLKSLPVDQFFGNVLYDKKFGYYNCKQPLGSKGDYITSPSISNLFSEIIAIWIVSTWEKFGKPKKFNIVELGPGEGKLTKTLLNVFKKFPEFNKAKKVYLYEISSTLKRVQKKNIQNKNIKWINNFKKIKSGPIIFFGNEFFDAIPIKQFKRERGNLFEKYFKIQKNNKISEIYKKVSLRETKIINSYKSLRNLKFIEFPKNGFVELKKIVKKISELNGCLLIIDYGYLKSNNLNTLQSVFKHRKNFILKNLGRADVTSHVNFELLNEFFLKNNLKFNETITQREFLQNMGIKERANLISRKMKFSDQADLYLRIRRLLNPNAMGNLFKVSLAYNLKTNYFGFN